MTIQKSTEHLSLIVHVQLYLTPGHRIMFAGHFCYTHFSLCNTHNYMKLVCTIKWMTLIAVAFRFDYVHKTFVKILSNIRNPYARQFDYATHCRVMIGFWLQPPPPFPPTQVMMSSCTQDKINVEIYEELKINSTDVFAICVKYMYYKTSNTRMKYEVISIFYPPYQHPPPHTFKPTLITYIYQYVYS